MSPPTAGCCAGRAMTGCTAAEDAAGATSAWPGMAYMGPGSACWCSGQSGAARAGAPCHATGYLHPRLPHVIFSLVDTQWVGCSRVLKPHPVLPPLNPLCISFVDTCFTAIVPSFSLVIAKANPPKARTETGRGHKLVPLGDEIPKLRDMRSAHSRLTDEQFEDYRITTTSLENRVPVSSSCTIPSICFTE